MRDDTQTTGMGGGSRDCSSDLPIRRAYESLTLSELDRPPLVLQADEPDRVWHFGEAYLTGNDCSETAWAIDMAREVAARTERAFDGLAQRLNVVFTEHDPYPTFDALKADVRSCGRMLVYTGDSHTPLWPELLNWKVRAVHDFRHHVEPDVGFDLPGEVAAFRNAASEAPGLAPLYFSEIVLQAAAFHVLGGRFPDCDQKFVRVDEQLMRHV